MHDSRISDIKMVNDKEVWSTANDEVKIWNVNGELQAKMQLKGRIFCLLSFPENARNTSSKTLRNNVWIGTEEVDKKTKQSKAKIAIYDVITRKAKRSFKLTVPEAVDDSDDGIAPPPTCLLYHGNHVWIASGRIIYCYEPNTLQSKGYLDSHTHTVRYMISVGDELWSCGDDKVIKVWRPEKDGGNVLFTLQGHIGTVHALSTDGAAFVWSCGWGKQFLMWDMKSHGFSKFSPEKHVSHLSTVIAVKKGPELEIWSGGDDKIIHVWKLQAVTTSSI